MLLWDVNSFILALSNPAHNVTQHCRLSIHGIAGWTSKKSRKLLISDRWHSACSQFQFCPWIIPLNGRCLAPNFVVLDENFPTKSKFSDRVKFFFGGGQYWHYLTDQDGRIINYISYNLSLLWQTQYTRNVEYYTVISKKFSGHQKPSKFRTFIRIFSN